MLIRRGFYRWQFAAAIVLPVWLLLGYAFFGSSGWGVIGLMFATPIAFISLGVVALVVAARPDVRRTKAVDWADVAVLGRHVDAFRSIEEDAVAERDAAALGPVEAGERRKRRRLAAAARPEQRQELAIGDREADAVDGAEGVEGAHEILHDQFSHRFSLRRAA